MLITALLLSNGLHLPSASPPGNSASPSLLTVHVQDAGTPNPSSGAKVQILASSGAVLTETLTSETGDATLTKPPDSAEPSLILVRTQAFYIGGVPWSRRTNEVCVHLAIRR